MLVALAQANGDLWLSLRPPGDTGVAPLGPQLLPVSAPAPAEEVE
jgi:hypothetical protein